MRRLLLSWLVWLTLGVTCLNTTVAFMLAGLLLARFPDTVPTLTESHPGSADPSGDPFFKETPSVSQELSLQCARQSKRALARVGSLHLSAQERQPNLRPWSMAAAVSLPFVLFFPRQLSPPSATDEPFLS
jgi:hypothetical protein